MDGPKYSNQKDRVVVFDPILFILRNLLFAMVHFFLVFKGISVPPKTLFVGEKSYFYRLMLDNHFRLNYFCLRNLKI